jgi:tetratricopeptide (TPR) repeat protein
VAVVGDAYIVVRAITTNVKDDIRNGFKGVKGETSKMGQEAGSAFGQGFGRNFSREAEQASKAFGKLMRQGYFLQSGIGAAAGALSALVGGLGAFVGVAAGAAASGIALVGAMAQIKLASAVGKSAFKGIAEAVNAADSAAGGNTKTIRELREELQQLAFAAEEAALGEEAAALSLEKARETLARVQSLPPDNRARREAELAYQQAELKYRQAKDKNKDAQEELLNPSKKGGSGKDPFANLTESQKVFAKYLVSIKGRFKELNEAAASSFLPTLQGQLEKLFSSGYFDMLVDGYSKVSKGIADAAERIGDSLFDPEARENLSTLFASTGRNATAFGKILGSSLKSILGLLRAADPLISRFLVFLSEKSAKNAANISGNFASISGFFRTAGDAAADFGAVFGNVMKGFGAMIKANVGPGSGGRMLLDSLRQSTEWMGKLNTVTAEYSSKNYFIKVAENTKAILGAFSGLGKILKDIGTMPEVKEFWTTLQGGQGSLEKILRSSVEASPKLAELLVQITKILAVFADSEQIKAYFEVLNAVVTAIAGFLAGLQKMFDAVGPLIGRIGALITIFLLFRKVALITFGVIMVPMKAYAALQGIIIARQVAKQGLDAIETTNAYKQAIANSTVITSMTGMGVAADKTAISAARMWAAIGGPLTLALVGIAAVVAAIVAIDSAARAAIETVRKNTVKKLTEDFKESAEEGLNAADATRQWAIAVKAATDDWGNASGRQDNMLSAGIAKTIEAYNELAKLNDANGTVALFTGGISEATKKTLELSSVGANGVYVWIGEIQGAMDDAQQAMGAYSDSINEIAKKDLPTAQRQFRNMVYTQGLSRDSALKMITDNTDLQETYRRQAEAIGLVITNTEGAIDPQKALEVALGEGAYAARIQKLEMERLAKVMLDAMDTFIDFEGPLNQAKEDLKGYTDVVTDSYTKNQFSLQKYMDDMKAQFKRQTEWTTNLAKLQKTMSSDAYNELVAKGVQGASLVEALAKGGQKAVDAYEKQRRDLAAMQADAKLLQIALVNDKAIRGIVGRMGGTVANYYNEVFNNRSKSIAQVADELGISNQTLIDEARRMNLNIADEASKVNISATWETGTLTNLKKDFEDKMGTFKITVSELKADGGYVGRGYANRKSFKPFAATGSLGPKGYYDGGLVFGQGGPRQDRIPAYLSNGEYVINAAATAKNLELLKAINSGQQMSSGGVNISVHAAPGMNEMEVANLVSAKLNFELSRGMNA